MAVFNNESSGDVVVFLQQCREMLLVPRISERFNAVLAAGKYDAMFAYQEQSIGRGPNRPSRFFRLWYYRVSHRQRTRDPSVMDSEALPQMLDGRYRLESVLGRGGMSIVYRATDTRVGRTVALKIMRGGAMEAIGVERFLREIAVTASFAHPHVLPLLESGKALQPSGESLLYYVTPLIDGETVGDRLVRDGRLPLPDALRIAREVLEALRYAHDHNVIHPDIKPANILLSDGHAVVADFGVARALPGRKAPLTSDSQVAITLSGFTVGTPAYMSPEQALADKSVDARSDLYAVGCLLYEMLTGVAPFDAPTAQAVVARKMNGWFVPLLALRPGLPAELQSIAERALKPEPADRYATAAAFLAALAPLLETGSSSRAQEVVSAKQNFKRPVVVAAVLVAAALAVAFWANTRTTGTTRALDVAAPYNPARVAVLPFENLTGDSSSGYIANGLTTDLIDELAQVGALTVISKNGVAPFRGTNATVDSIARTLRVGSIVTGDVRQQNDSIRVRVRLVDGVSGQQLAIHDTSAARSEFLQLRSAVVSEAARFLRERLGEQVRIVTDSSRAESAEAWQIVEQVRALRENTLPATVRLDAASRAQQFASADSLLQHASTLDPHWPDPEVLRGLLAIDHAAYELAQNPPGARASTSSAMIAERLWLDAERHANAALGRDAHDANALHLRGQSRMERWGAARTAAADSLRDLAERDFRDAVQQRPQFAAALVDLSSLEQLSGEFEEARNAALEALKADAYLRSANPVMSRLQIASLGAGRPDEARTWCTQGRQRFPRDVRFIGCELTTLGWTGKTGDDVANAWRVLANAEQLDSNHVLQSGWGVRRMFVAAIAARAALPDSANAIVSRTRAALPAGIDVEGVEFVESYVHTELGQFNEALQWLRKYLSVHPTRTRLIARHPWFEKLRGEPMFMELVAH